MKKYDSKSPEFRDLVTSVMSAKLPSIKAISKKDKEDKVIQIPLTQIRPLPPITSIKIPKSQNVDETIDENLITSDIPVQGNLTGIKDTELIIMAKLNDKDLLNYCIANKTILKTCYDESFWRNRFISKFDLKDKEPLSKYRKPNQTWRDFYLMMIYYIDKYSTSSFLFRKGCGNGNLALVVHAMNTNLKNDLNYDRALKSVAEGEYYDIVKYLVKNKKGDPSDVLNWLCAYAPLDVIEFVVEDANLNVSYNDDLPLRWASKRQRLDVIDYLLKKGANINANNGEILKWPSKFGNFKLVKYLVSQGAKTNPETNLPLKEAILNEHIEIVKFLVENGATVDDDIIQISKFNSKIYNFLNKNKS